MGLTQFLTKNEDDLIKKLRRPKPKNEDDLPTNPNLMFCHSPTNPNSIFCHSPTKPNFMFCHIPTNPSMIFCHRPTNPNLIFCYSPTNLNTIFCHSPRKGFCHPQTRILINKETDVSYLRFAGFFLKYSEFIFIFGQLLI